MQSLPLLSVDPIMPDAQGHPTRSEMNLGNVLAALSDPMRRGVVAELVRAQEGTERTCVSFGLPVSKATLTHHFRVLREAGLIRQVDHGNSRTTKLRREDLEAKFPGLLALIRAEQPAKSNAKNKQREGGEKT